MKRSLKTIVTLLFVLCTFVLTESLHAWWSSGKHEKRKMHFNLITLSESKLKAEGLFNRETLDFASQCPDGPDKTFDHKNPIRMKENFCSIVGMALTKEKGSDPIKGCARECKTVIDCLGRTFHYFEDYADSTHIDSEHVMNDLRLYAYDHFNSLRVKSMDDQANYFYKNMSNDYNSFVDYIDKQMDGYKDGKTPVKGLKQKLWEANRKEQGKPRNDARDAVFITNFALIKAGQDKLVDLYKTELGKDASEICKDTPAYCKGLEKKIDESCKIKDLTKVKEYLKKAKEAKSHEEQACKNLINREGTYLQKCKPVPVTISVTCPQGCNVMSGAARKDLTLTVYGDVQFPLTYVSRFIKAPACGTSFQQGSQPLSQNMMTHNGANWQHTFKGSIFCNVGSKKPECQSFTYTYHHWITTASNQKSNVVQMNYQCTSHNTVPQSKTYPNPLYGGLPLDHCLSFATNCNQPTADKFCRDKKFRRASKLSVKEAKMTKLYSGETCTNPPTNCHAFSSITCE